MIHITYFEQIREDKQVVNKTTYTPKLSQAIQIHKLQSLLHYLTYLERMFTYAGLSLYELRVIFIYYEKPFK